MDTAGYELSNALPATALCTAANLSYTAGAPACRKYFSAGGLQAEKSRGGALGDWSDWGDWNGLAFWMATFGACSLGIPAGGVLLLYCCKSDPAAVVDMLVAPTSTALLTSCLIS